jgi:hypothetical protein
LSKPHLFLLLGRWRRAPLRAPSISTPFHDQTEHLEGDVLEFFYTNPTPSSTVGQDLQIGNRGEEEQGHPASPAARRGECGQAGRSRRY